MTASIPQYEIDLSDVSGVLEEVEKLIGRIDRSLVPLKNTPTASPLREAQKNLLKLADDLSFASELVRREYWALRERDAG